MLQTIETELVNLRLDSPQERLLLGQTLRYRQGITPKVHNLLRAAHSIKGCAASLGLEEIESLAHQLEDIFRVLDRPELPFDRELELLLFELFDRLEQLITAQIKGEILSPSFHASTQSILVVLDEKIGHFVIEGRQTPEDDINGLDLVRSIFEVDVAESLVRLKDILLDPDFDRISIGEFRAQAEVFTGIALLTNTLNFGIVARNTIEALDLDPDRGYEICCFALVNFYAALETILTDKGEVIDRRCAESHPLIQHSAEITVPFSIIFDLEDIFDLPDSEIFTPKIADSLSLHFDLEDIFDLPYPEILTPKIADSLSLHFDLEDIFDLPYPEIFTPKIADSRSLSFDLEDIFDLSTPRAVCFPERDVLTSLRFDLEDIFDLPSPSSFPLSPVLKRCSTWGECGLGVSPREHLAGNPKIALSAPPFKLLIANITSNFDKFASITPATFAQPSKAIKPIRAKKSRKITPNSTPQLSVRVTLDRLERMNNLMGELAIEGNGLAVSSEQVTDTLDQLRSKCANFQTIGDRLQEIAEALSIHTQPPLFGRNLPELSPGEDLDEQFDILELDRYSEVHHIAQATIEQLAQIEEQIEDLALFTSQSHHQIDRQKQLLSHLREDLMWARMLPLGEILNRFPRTIHDLSIEFNKPVDLRITGAGVLVDRAVIDKLLDPLIHIIRNAFDHGIDLLAARKAMNKPERGSIDITAYHQGSHTVIEIADDGRGMDIDRIKSKAIALKLLTPIQVARATTEQLLDLIFTPGFSTADRITKLSGRGMGLDIVKEQIQSIKGTISIDSKLGRGTIFTLRIPLTLTVAQLMVCQVGNALYAFPAASIQKIVVPTLTQIASQDSQRIFHWRDLTIPIYNLADLLTYSIPVPERTVSHTLKSSATNPEDWLSPLLLIRTRDRIVAFEIDRLITEQELTIKPFGKAITPPSYSYGCTILGDGAVLPVLDPHTLIQVLIDRSHSPLIAAISAAPAINSIDSLAPRILVVDDSITTRQSLCLSLEKFGYRTFQAKDGQEAIQTLRQKTGEIKLVVCDVEMPNMNGFEFLNVYRQDATLTHIPVVMLTSRSNAKHRQFAAHLGAVDYFIKPYVEQDFITAIGKIINQGDRG